MFMFIYALFKMINCTYFEFSPQATGGRKGFSSDTMSQMSMDSATSGESKVTGGCFLQTMTLLQVPRLSTSSLLNRIAVTFLNIFSRVLRDSMSHFSVGPSVTKLF